MKNAIFLPFDLDSFKFFNKNPNGPLSRERQEPAFRALNRMVHSFSSISSLAEAREVIEGWYGGDLFGGTFDGSYVQAGWRGSENEKQLYRKLYAVACRTCHISYVSSAAGDRPALKFASFADFTMPPVGEDMCGSGHRMPAAEQTLKVLWRSAARAHYFGQVPGAFGDCAP